MTDKEKAQQLLNRIVGPVTYMVSSELRDIVDRNQNPGCGGDGSMSEMKWTMLRDATLFLEGLCNRAQMFRDGLE